MSDQDQIMQPQEEQPQVLNLREPKVPMPERFNGSRRGFRPFMSQVNTVFRLNSSRFTSEYNKILFIGSLLTGDAAIWFEAMDRVPGNAIMESYATFLNGFTVLFSDPASASIARRKIKLLHQGTMSASTYAMKFTSLSLETGFNDAALLDAFSSNLNNKIKDIISTSIDVPENFDEFVNYAIKVDNRVYERRMESNGSFNNFSFGNTYQASPVRPVVNDPMELDNLQVGQPRGPINQDERDRRRRLNLCLYCGAEGHIVRDCPTKNVQGRREPRGEIRRPRA
jgi:Retrotransposon gag protein/Zinc knuckle